MKPARADLPANLPDAGHVLLPEQPLAFAAAITA